MTVEQERAFLLNERAALLEMLDSARAQLARAEKVIAAVPDAIAMLRTHGYTCELMRAFAEYDCPPTPQNTPEGGQQ